MQSYIFYNFCHESSLSEGVERCIEVYAVLSLHCKAITHLCTLFEHGENDKLATCKKSEVQLHNDIPLNHTHMKYVIICVCSFAVDVCVIVHVFAISAFGRNAQILETNLYHKQSISLLILHSSR